MSSFAKIKPYRPIQHKEFLCIDIIGHSEGADAKCGVPTGDFQFLELAVMEMRAEAKPIDDGLSSWKRGRQLFIGDKAINQRNKS